MKPSRKTLNHAKAPDPFVKASESFDSARDCLLQLSESMMFVRVINIQPNNAHQMGEALEVPMGHGHGKENPKTVFFDKFGRCKGPLKMGPITLVQAPLGPDHPSSIPSVGELLIGSAVPNTRKSHLQYVLRGWCSSAQPLWELLRMIKYGTRQTEVKVRDILLQLPCSMTLCPKDLKEYRDSIQMIARIVLQGNVRPMQVLATLDQQIKLKEEPTEIEVMAAKQTKIGSKSFDFIDLCTVKLNCPAIQEKFLEGIDVESMPEEPKDPQQNISLGQQSASTLGMAPTFGTSLGENAYSGQAAPSFRPATPPAYEPQSPIPAQMPKSPEMKASSPAAGRSPSPTFGLDDD